jgi:hypothetical protein
MMLVPEQREPGRKVLAYLLRLWLERGAAVRDHDFISRGDKAGGY